MKEKFVSTIPDVGMVATLQMHTDRVVYLITYVSPSGKTIRLRRAELVGSKKYVLASFDTEERTARKDESGQWRQTGTPGYRPVFTIGVANPYHDRSF